MIITDEVIKSGSITVYDDTENRYELEKEVEDYNNGLLNCRKQMKLIEDVKTGFLAMNPIVVMCIAVAEAEAFFAVMPLAIVVLAINAAAYVIFALFKNKFLVSAIASALLILADWKFVFLFAANIIIAVIHERLVRSLKAHAGYPAFADIRVVYERGNAPKQDQEI